MPWEMIATGTGAGIDHPEPALFVVQVEGFLLRISSAGIAVVVKSLARPVLYPGVA